MKYQKGEAVLPSHLLQEVQKYVDGSLLYIPKASKKVGWGCSNGTKEALKDRNSKIARLFREGQSIGKLSEKFYLSEETIKKIVYGRKQV